MSEARRSWITFLQNQQIFALPVDRIQEILEVDRLETRPEAPPPVRGVARVRGHQLPVVDLGERLWAEPATLGPHSRILVVLTHGQQVGFLVDATRAVAKISPQRILPPPAEVLTRRSGGILGFYPGELFTILLDADGLALVPEPVST